MGKMKDWMMDHDDLINEAIANGLTFKTDIIEYVRWHLGAIDERYIVNYLGEMIGYDDDNETEIHPA